MWLTPKEVEVSLVTGLMISLVSDAYHIAPTFSSLKNCHFHHFFYVKFC